jgi:facilitated trehalose transporter
MKIQSLQIFASTVPVISSISAGMAVGYSAILLPQLRSDNNLSISLEEESWIASIAALPMAAGCIFGGFAMEKYGRKMALFLVCLFTIFGWVMLSIAPNIILILAGRFFTGLSVGMLGPPSSVYIGETSEPRYRGFLLAWISLSVSMGILVSHVLGTYLHWSTVAGLSTILPALCCVLLLFIPESPSWLLSQNRIKDSEITYRWLRGSELESLNEFEDMVRKQNFNTKLKKSFWQSLAINCKKTQFLKPLAIILLFFFVLQFSGVNAVIFYTVSILNQINGSDIDQYTAMIVIDVVRVTMCGLACVLIKKCNRRLLTAISGFGTALTMIALSIFLWLPENENTEVDKLAWFPLVALVGYICFVSIGIFPLPWCMIGELFPLAMRGVGSGLVTTFNFACFFMVVKLHPSFFSNIGPNGTFLMYGIIVLIGTFVLLIILPETRNKTLQQIEDKFNDDNDSTQHKNRQRSSITADDV